MLKRTLAALLALLLAVVGLPTLAFADNLPTPLIPNRMVEMYNLACNILVDQMEKDQTEDSWSEVADSMKLNYDQTEDYSVFYTNSNSNLMMVAFYDDQKADPDQPAAYWGITVFSSSEEVIGVIGMILGAAIATCDPSIDGVALVTWIQNNLEDGAQYEMSGYSLHIDKVQDSFTFFLFPNSSADDTLTKTVDSITGKVVVKKSDKLIEWNGFSVQLLRAELRHYSDGDSSIRLVCRFVNKTDRSIWVKLEDATLNGVPVYAAGESDIYAGMDTGADSSEYLLLKPEDINDSANAAFEAPKTAAFTLRLKDNESFEELAVKKVTLSLEDWLVEP